jgi:osmotically-inducible protein OsmY
MSSPAVIADPTMSDYGAVWLMSEHDINRLPIVKRDTLVGVVTRTDLTAEFARSDETIAEAIRRDVLEALSVPEVTVEVVDGRVVLDGVVDREEDSRCLSHAVSQVPGVVDVQSNVTMRTPA